jgi:hypothetical protein
MSAMAREHALLSNVQMLAFSSLGISPKTKFIIDKRSKIIERYGMI